MANLYSTSGPSLNAEPATQYVNRAGTHIKPDPDAVGTISTAIEDEDIYEDAGDLEFFGAAQEVYLTRLPKFLWENWSKLDDDQEIRLGTVRVEGGLGDAKRISLLLSNDIPKNEAVPKEYNMHITNTNPLNTFIFTEKDLPGHTANGKGSRKEAQSGGGHAYLHGPPRPHFQDRGRQGSQNIDKNRKFQPYIRKAIPKRTAVAGHVQTEINCLPVENEEYRRIMDERTKQAMKPKRETKMLNGLVSSHAGNLLAPGTLGNPGNFKSFIKTTGAGRGKRQELKAARIPENELLDQIYDCFSDYNHWPFKALKAKLKQPEAYLKATLEKVAFFIKAGERAMTWKLKPEARISAYVGTERYKSVKDEVAPDRIYGMDGASDAPDPEEEPGSEDDEDDDENIQMDDVLIE